MMAAYRNQKSGILFCLDWNVLVKDDSNAKTFKINSEEDIDGNNAIHLAAEIPSLLIINELSFQPGVNNLHINNLNQLPSDIVPDKYLSSKKVLVRVEKKALKKSFKDYIIINKVPSLRFIQDDKTLRAFLIDSGESFQYSKIPSRQDITTPKNMSQQVNSKVVNDFEINDDIEMNSHSDEDSVAEENTEFMCIPSFESHSIGSERFFIQRKTIENSSRID